MNSVMAGHGPSKTGVNALMPGHPRLASTDFRKKDVDARNKSGHDGAILNVLRSSVFATAGQL
jgi:hypothetical protein